ncbi:MAG TPA: hypothetical protein VH328_03220, partial [Burkholderiaceae bacterium]|nr:hypothetical protein [Burkholderiaceae bacterium]
MKAWIPLTMTTALCLAGYAHADCSHPQSPGNPPDGNTASKDQMVSAAKDTKRYNDEMTAYLACLDMAAPKEAPKEAKKDPKKRTPEEQAKVDTYNAYAKQHDAVVDEMHTFVDKFNE